MAHPSNHVGGSDTFWSQTIIKWIAGAASVIIIGTGGFLIRFWIESPVARFDKVEPKIEDVREKMIAYMERVASQHDRLIRIETHLEKTDEHTQDILHKMDTLIQRIERLEWMERRIAPVPNYRGDEP